LYKQGSSLSKNYLKPEVLCERSGSCCEENVLTLVRSHKPSKHSTTTTLSVIDSLTILSYFCVSKNSANIQFKIMINKTISQRNYTIVSLLRSNNFTAVNNDLMAAIGALEAVVLSKILSYADYYYKNNLVDDEGWFKYLKLDIQKQTNTGETAINSAVKRLVEYGLVEYKSKGLPATGHFRLSEDFETRVYGLLQPAKLIKFSLPEIKELETGNQGTVDLISRNSRPDFKEHIIIKNNKKYNKKGGNTETHIETLKQTAMDASVDYDKLMIGIDQETLNLLILENIEYNKSFKPIKLIQYLKSRTPTKKQSTSTTNTSNIEVL
jgi:hypothetical protein